MVRLKFDRKVNKVCPKLFRLNIKLVVKFISYAYHDGKNISAFMVNVNHQKGKQRI